LLSRGVGQGAGVSDELDEACRHHNHSGHGEGARDINIKCNDLHKCHDNQDLRRAS